MSVSEELLEEVDAILREADRPMTPREIQDGILDESVTASMLIDALNELVKEGSVNGDWSTGTMLYRLATAEERAQASSASAAYPGDCGLQPAENPAPTPDTKAPKRAKAKAKAPATEAVSDSQVRWTIGANGRVQLEVYVGWMRMTQEDADRLIAAARRKMSELAE